MRSAITRCHAREQTTGAHPGVNLYGRGTAPAVDTTVSKPRLLLSRALFGRPDWKDVADGEQGT